MALELSYQSRRSRNWNVKRLISIVKRRRFIATASVLVFLYGASYVGLRMSGVLVRQDYIRWREATPGSTVGGGYDVEEHNIGHGSFFDANGHPKDDAVSGIARVIFFPLVRMELWLR